MGIKKEKEFVDKLNENIVGKEIYIWGAGQHANNLLDVLQKYKFKLDKIKGIIDSDIKKMARVCIILLCITKRIF